MIIKRELWSHPDGRELIVSYVEMLGQIGNNLKQSQLLIKKGFRRKGKYEPGINKPPKSVSTEL